MLGRANGANEWDPGPGVVAGPLQVVSSLSITTSSVWITGASGHSACLQALRLIQDRLLRSYVSSRQKSAQASKLLKYIIELYMPVYTYLYLPF